MTGPEHFQEAERLTQIIHDQVGNKPLSAADTIALGQLHATLANVYAHNRATTELTGLLHAMLGQIREAQEARS